MMRPALIGGILGIALAFLTGCATVQLDMQKATERAKAGQAAGILSANDPLVMCLEYFQGAIGPQGGLAILKPPFAGVIDTAVDLYLLDALASAGGTSDALDQYCGGVAVKILKNAGRRAPGL